MTTVYGFDISDHQGSGFDFKSAYAEGYRLSIIRAGVCRSDGSIVMDGEYLPNVEAARATGLEIGHYFYFNNTRTGKDQAEEFLSYLEQSEAYKDIGRMRALKTVVWLDVEVDTSIEEISNFYNRFREGWEMPPLGIYTSSWMWSQVEGADDSSLDMSTVPLWVADWGDVEEPRLPDGWTTYNVWQWTNEGTVAGRHPVDLNSAVLKDAPVVPDDPAGLLDSAIYHIEQAEEHLVAAEDNIVTYKELLP